MIGEEAGGGTAIGDAAAFEHERVLGQRQRDLGMLLDQDEGAECLP